MHNRLKKKSVYIGLSLSKSSLRLGEFRTFLYTYILGRKNDFAVYIRIDDTNPENHNISYKNQIIAELERFGIIFSNEELTYWHGDLLLQSQQKDIYIHYLDKLRKIDVLSERNDLVSVDIQKVVKKFSHSIPISADILRRKTKFDIDKCGYTHIPLYVINEDRFLFHLPCVVDEYYMNTSLAIRGEDKMPLMPIHDMLRNLLGFPLIEYLHLPLLLMPESTKRLTGAEYSLEALLKNHDQQDICAYTIKSGYNLPTTKDINMDEFLKIFDINKIKKQSSHFNVNEI